MAEEQPAAVPWHMFAAQMAAVVVAAAEGMPGNLGTQGSWEAFASAADSRVGQRTAELVVALAVVEAACHSVDQKAQQGQAAVAAAEVQQASEVETEVAA